jgi:hypothetical protein
MIAGVTLFFAGSIGLGQMVEEIGREVIPPLANQQLQDLNGEQGADVAPTDWSDAISRYVRVRRQIFISEVRRSIKREVIAELQDAFDEGEDLQAVIRQWREELRGAEADRARRIGVTEVTVASAVAILAAAALFGGETDTAMVKRWISQLDERVRRPPNSRFNHLSPHGQTVPMGRPFIISDEELMFPGDISLGASLGNVINCRCLPLPLPRPSVDESEILMT